MNNQMQVEKKTSSNTDNFNGLTLDPKQKLWHILLGDSGQHSLHLASDTCNGIPNSQKHSLFKQGDCITGKFHKYKKGFHDENTAPKPGELFQMDCYFVRGNTFSSKELNETPSNDVNHQTMPL